MDNAMNKTLPYAGLRVVEFTHHVETLLDKMRVSVAPLRYGAAMRRKAFGANAAAVAGCASCAQAKRRAPGTAMATTSPPPTRAVERRKPRREDFSSRFTDTTSVEHRIGAAAAHAAAKWNQALPISAARCTAARMRW